MTGAQSVSSEFRQLKRQEADASWPVLTRCATGYTFPEHTPELEAEAAERLAPISAQYRNAKAEVMQAAEILIGERLKRSLEGSHEHAV